VAKWKKSPEELVSLLADRMKGVNCEQRKMFGYPAYFINGKMFAGLFEDQMFIRLPDDEMTRFQKEYTEAKHFEPLKGRIMKNYVVVPKEVYSSDENFRPWVLISTDFTKSLSK